MRCFSSPAILIRRIDHGDFDLILTFLTLEFGKLSCIAKYAKKSVKRFGGVLELFHVLDIVCAKGRGKLPILKEASLLHPFVGIRSRIEKTAYASYWAQLVHLWMEEEQEDPGIFALFRKSLEVLDAEESNPETASILFQAKFLALSGVGPNLERCGQCGRILDEISGGRVTFDLAGGGIVCGRCVPRSNRKVSLSRGVVKQLGWIGEKSWEKALRVRFSEQARQESLAFLETFVPFHLGVRPKSLSFLRQIRREKRGREGCAKDGGPEGRGER